MIEHHLIDDLEDQVAYLQELKEMGVNNVFDLPVYEQRLILNKSVIEMAIPND